MIKATEAWELTKKHDKYAEQLAQIEVLIQNEAEHGGSYTWWYCENMGKYEQKKLAERLEEFGYTITIGDNVIYINWTNAKTGRN